jgi:poly(A) polymerase
LPVGSAPPTVIPRSAHNITRKNIAQSALKVLYRLVEAGHEAYLVGGGVRDLVLDKRPKDFDIATSAKPEEVKALFGNCRLIGRRFRLAHVRFGREVVEVATFRAGQGEDDDRVNEDGRLLTDNVYGSREDDAARRDFTVNSLYYDIRDFSILDFANGMDDLNAGVLRMIGDPEVRYREDPVRVLRALRFAAKLGFGLSPETEAPVVKLSRLLVDIPPARLFDEVLKLLMSGHAVASFELLRKFEVLQYLFPLTDDCINDCVDGATLRMLEQAMENTDARLAQSKPVTPGYLFAALLWGPVREQERYLQDQNPAEEDPQAFHERAASMVISEQIQRVSLPRRFSQMAREIWALQPRLEKRTRRDASNLLGNPRFRAAYDFLVLRAEAGEPVKEAADWWTEYQELDEEGRNKALNELAGAGGRRRRGPRRRRPRVA